MNINSKISLIHFSDKHPELRNQFYTWYKVIESKNWKTLNEIKEAFPRSSILNDQRMVFRIKSYRLIVAFNFNKQAGYIKWIGAHDEYDNLDANSVSKF